MRRDLAAKRQDPEFRRYDAQRASAVKTTRRARERLHAAEAARRKHELSCAVCQSDTPCPDDQFLAGYIAAVLDVLRGSNHPIIAKERFADDEK